MKRARKWPWGVVVQVLATRRLLGHADMHSADEGSNRHQQAMSMVHAVSVSVARPYGLTFEAVQSIRIDTLTATEAVSHSPD